MRLIDADALKERIEYSFHNHERVRIDTVTGTFLTEYCSPTIEAEPVKYGLWMYEVEAHPELYGWVPLDSVVCSLCEKSNNIKQPYCPNCGAKMDLERKENQNA